MSECCNSCGVGQYSGTPGQALVELLSPITNGGIPFISIMQNKNLGLSHFLFDEQTLKDENGREYLTYTFKEGLGKNSKFSYVTTNGNCELEWREQYINDISAVVATNATASLTVTVQNISTLAGAGAGTEIFIPGASLQQATIVSVSGNTITLDTAVTVVAGDCIYRGAYNKVKDCITKIDNKYTLRDEAVYSSKFRKIMLSLEFQTCELSVDRLVSYMNNGNGAEKFIMAHKQRAVDGFVSQFKWVFWTDRNISTANGDETMGVLRRIEKAQNDLDKTLIIDMSYCCPVNATCGSDTKVVELFFDVIRKAFKSGLYTNNTVTVVGNYEFGQNLQKMQAAFQDVTGVSVIYDLAVRDQFVSKQSFPVIQLGAITVEFMYDDTLDLVFKESAAVVLPKDQIYLSQRKYGHLTNDMKSTNEVNAAIDSGFPRLKFIDRTAFDTNGEGDCYKFISTFEFAIALGGVDHCGWYILKNFAPCTASCDVCTDGVRGTL